MKRIISLLLVITLVLCSGVLTALPVAAETRTGITFTAADTYRSESAMAAMPATFEAWIKVAADAPATRLGVIAGNYNSTSHASVNYEIRTNGNPSIWWAPIASTDSTTQVFTDVDVRTGEWLHLAIVNEGSALKCYVNGELKQTLDVTLMDLSDANVNSIKIGGDLRPGNGQYFKGAISSVALYQDARSQTEISTAMTNPDYTDPNMLCGYDLSVSGNDRLKDYSLQGNHLYYANSSDSSLDEIYNGANVSPDNGMTFSSEATYRVNSGYGRPVYTYEASIWVPKTITGRGGVILGNYGSGNPVASFEIYTNGAPRLYIVNKEGSSKSYVFDEVNVALSKWVHLAIVRDEANAQLHCYVDGSLKQTLAIDDGGYDAPTIGFGFGGDMRGGNTAYFQGILRSVAVYDDVRTADEVRADVKTLDTNGLIAAYDTADVAENVREIADQSGNGYTVKINRTWLDEQPALDDYAYSFAMVGDTQNMNEKYSENFHLIYDWLLDNVESQKMEFVFGLGDITNSDTVDEWERAMTHITRMDGVVPYSLVRGNHDSVSRFTEYVSFETFGDTVEGTYDGTMLNTWRTLKVGEIDYLLMTLDYGPSDPVLNWACEVIEQHMNYRVIITTHCYLYRDGTTLDAGDTAAPTKNVGYNNGDHMWEKLMKKYANIQLVVSGHDPSDYVVLSQEEGDYGNTVSAMLVDPQGTDNSVEGGTGMITMLYFSEDGNDVQVRTYSTTQKKWFMDANQYSFNMGNVDAVIAKQVMAQIDALSVKSLGDKNAVTKVRNTYEALNSMQKECVTNLEVLVAAENAIAKLEAEAEANVADKAAADAVVAQIAALNVQSLDDKAAVQAVRAAYDALTDTQKSYVTNDYALITAEEKIVALEEAVVNSLDIQFRSLDVLTGVNGAQNRSRASIYTEGTGAVKWAYSTDTTNNTPFYYIYCDDFTNVEGVDITGATHMTFDLYVEDVSKLVFTAGDAGINLSDASGSWNNAAGRGYKEEWLSALKNLKNGWNHLVMPINTDAATTKYVNRIRMYNVGGITTAGFYTILDDIRFVNQAYFDSGAYANSIAAKDVIAAISALDEQTVNDKATVTAIRAAYDGLTDTQKALVSNLAILEEAEAQFIEQEEAKAVEDAISALNVQSLDDKAAVVAVRVAYDALTDAQKAMVSNIDELETAESTIARLEEAADKEAAKAVEDAISALNVQSLDDASAVASARRAYDNLTEAQKGYVTNLETLEQAEDMIEELKAIADQEAIDKAAAKVVEDQIAALNVQSLDDKAAVQAARAAYNGLTATQKDLVPNLDKLEQAEKTIADLEALQPPVTITYGDVDGNGKVEATDALEVLKSVVGKVTLTDEQLKAADTDGNGKADATDALNILKKVVGKIDRFPVEQ